MNIPIENIHIRYGFCSLCILFKFQAYEIAVVKEQQKADEVRVLREQLQDAALLLEGKVSPTCTESLKQIMKLQSEVSINMAVCRYKSDNFSVTIV